MKKGLIVLGIFASLHVFGWGVIGHRTVGYIAEQHLNKKAKKEVKRILGNETLAISSNWMDEIKSDDNYDHTHKWHYVTIPDGKSYETSDKEPDGDIIQTIERLINELKSDTLNLNTEKENLKMLVHLVGDLHQPLHVGNGTDKGGNDIKLKWFWSSSNLHRVWDSGMIDSKQYSYTELGNTIDHATDQEIKNWQSTNIRDWAHESMELRDQCYENIPENKSINYEYSYKNWNLVQKRLLQAGIRLAGVINKIYG
ncbi:MAG: S1/P1 nuclease [Cyclobacteriaceae bacterium]|nr:S1/P1 nuclease [Cyclobacteriaceae bacterium]